MDDGMDDGMMDGDGGNQFVGILELAGGVQGVSLAMRKMWGR